VRRINYLIEEKKKIEDENAKRSKYTNKLELKIVQENLNNKGLRQKVTNLQDEMQGNVVREHLAEFDNKYSVVAATLASTNSTVSGSTGKVKRGSSLSTRKGQQQKENTKESVPNYLIQNPMASKGHA
jgi:Na+-translocating ferredoxin:NAD+ oxidoreductase RnfG subunit